jgi:RNA polymerase sigma-70 factor (ECF subfamily)
MSASVTPTSAGDLSPHPRVSPGVAPSDGELVLRARGGDLEAFAALISRYRDRFLRYARNMLGSPEDAEEAVQDALVRAHRALGSADPDRFGGWVYRILVNRCRTIARRRRWWRLMTDLDHARDLGVRHPAGDAAWREEIDRALARLPADQREAFLLKHVDELTYEEMSALTGSSVAALKMRVHRACERLRRTLESVT